jgi:hypothetical protein
MTQEEKAKAKPILFNTEMVKAILDNRKTVTRRIVKGFIPDEPAFGYTAFTPDNKISCRGYFGEKGYDSYEYGEKFFKLPYKVGDILYVRETFRYVDFQYIDDIWSASVEYKDGSYGDRMRWGEEGADQGIGWQPSIHMPKSAARIFLRVTDVRIEKLQNITAEQVILEGIRLSCRHDNYVCSANPCEFKKTGSCKDRYKETWNSTIKKKDLPLYGWDASPWVWVISFEVIEK